MRSRVFLAYLGLSALVIVLDQLTKSIILRQLVQGEVLTITPFFDLVLAFNKGAAFSFLADHTGWQRWFFTAVALLIAPWLVFLINRHQNERVYACALALILGGALGNVIDRFVHGAVVDFLYFHIGRYGWPAFNVADSAITLGVVLMLISQFQTSKKASNS